MKKVGFSVLLAAGLVLAGCSIGGNQGAGENGQPLVTTSFAPITYMAERVGGDEVAVEQIGSNAGSAHNFNPQPQDVARVETSEVFFYNGHSFDEWAERLAEEKGDSAVAIVENINLPELESSKEDDHSDEKHSKEDTHSDEEKHSDEKDHNHSEDEHGHSDEDGHGHSEDEHSHEGEEAHSDEKEKHSGEEKHSDEEGHDHDHDHSHGGVDPHAWLDPLLARQYVDVITAELSQIKPESADVFAQNAQELKNELSEIHEQYSSKLNECSANTVIVSHNSFQYAAARYNFNVLPIAGLSPSDEPSAQEFAKLIEEAEELGVKYVYFEESVNPALAQTFADEANLSTLTLYPIEGLSEKSIENGEDYLSLLRKNADALAQGLECK